MAVQISGALPGTTTLTFAIPGTGVSVQIPVTVTMDGLIPAEYTLTVNGGAGGGDYIAGSAVTIIAGTAPNGQQFKQWSITPSVSFVDGTSENGTTAKFTMPAEAVTATAIYEAIPTFAVAVNNGTGGGNYSVGATVTITLGHRPQDSNSKTGWSTAAV